MGYCFFSKETVFKIEKDNIEKAYEKLYKYAEENKEIIYEWAWLDPSDILTSSNLKDCLENCRWEIGFDSNTGDVNDICFIGEKFGNDLDLFNIIAEFVEDKSYIECVGEDGDIWRYKFKNKKCKMKYPKTKW